MGAFSSTHTDDPSQPKSTRVVRTDRSVIDVHGCPDPPETEQLYTSFGHFKLASHTIRSPSLVNNVAAAIENS